jgi:hypothetical protein
MPNLPLTGHCVCGGVRFEIDAHPGIRPSYRHHVGTAAVWEPLPDDGLPRSVGPWTGTAER